jgi:hypothetical protein
VTNWKFRILSDRKGTFLFPDRNSDSGNPSHKVHFSHPENNWMNTSSDGNVRGFTELLQDKTAQSVLARDCVMTAGRRYTRS